MLLQTQNLAIGYGSNVVQEGLSLNAQAGELICMLGQNGSGKSTLLRTLAGLQPQLSGSVSLGGTELQELSATERAKRLSLVLTERLSIDSTTVSDVVAMGRYPYSNFLGSLKTADRQAILTALEQVRLAEKANCFFNQLSDGEKQRVLIAKALAQQTPVILLDEPTAHLDLNNRIRILLLLKQLAGEQAKCVIISTHELDLALQIADTVWLMMPHKGISVGSPKQLIESGVFQEAFTDDNFSLQNHNGRLQVMFTK